MPDRPRRKQFVDVIATHHIDGSVCPSQIIIAGGPTYDIEEVKGMVPVHDMQNLKIINRYAIVVKGKETYLYKELGKWFVKMKA